MLLPPDAYELIGKAVAQQFKLIDARVDALVAKTELNLSQLTSKAEAVIIQIKDGKDGSDGLNGKDGRDGINGKDGSDGLNGKDGVDGKDGLNGSDGKDGIDGKDGAPGEKGEKGDSGEKGEAGEKGDPGIISAEAIAEAYKGVWTEGEYDRGQIVTWGGSLWLSLAKSADKPGEANENWKLIVKRGRDGKDGKNGDKGEKGEKGLKGDKGEIGYA